jgi:hypothetical protein
MRPPRFHLRTLLVAVAVAAVLLGGWRLLKRREYCPRSAATLEQAADFYESLPYRYLDEQRMRMARRRSAAVGWRPAIAGPRHPWIAVPADRPRPG